MAAAPNRKETGKKRERIMSEHEHDDNFEFKYVGYVALAIGLVVFLSGMGGLLLNLAS